jgi:hypothetical protein
MHYSDSLLTTFYSSYMFRHMYVIIREPSLCVQLSYIKDSTVYVICQKVFTSSGCS